MSETLGRRGFLCSLAGGTALAATAVATRATAAVKLQQFGPESALSLDVAKRCGPPASTRRSWRSSRPGLRPGPARRARRSRRP